PGISTVQQIGTVTVGPDEIDGVPKHMPGDVPGTAPVYVHVCPDASASVRNPDGSGEDVAWIEYWLFYGQDESGESILGAVTLDIAGHRGDWETVAMRVATVLGPGGAFVRSELRRACFSAHGDATLVEL